MASINTENEQHYNVRTRVPEHMEVFNRWAERSQITRNNARVVADIRYDPGEKGTLDLFLPDQPEGSVPLHLFIHGGYWQAMDKSHFSFLAEPFLQRGIAVAVINYDLCPDVDLYQIVDQVRNAIIWAVWEGASMGVDADQIHVSGHSAGGHLLAMLLSTDWSHFGLPNNVIKSGVSVSGVFDLLPLVNTTINDKVGMSEQDAQALSPLHQPALVKCPMLLIYGEDEGAGFAWQSKTMKSHLQTEGLSVDLVEVSRANHFAALETLCDKQSPVFNWLLSRV